MYKNLALNLFTLFFSLYTLSLCAQGSTNKRGEFYVAIGAGAGMNAWEIREAQFAMVYYMSSSDFINTLKSVTNQKVAPHFNFNFELGNTHKWFANTHFQLTIGGMTGLQVGLAGGLNLPFEVNKKQLLVQVGAGIGYLNTYKELDNRRLREPIRLQRQVFNTIYDFSTSLIENNFTFSPLATLKYPITKIASLRLTIGYQFIITKNTRIRFSQRTSTRNSSSTRTANFLPDDTLFDFQYNNQYIQRLPFDYSGFFVTLGAAWGF